MILIYRLVEFTDKRGMEYALEKMEGIEVDGRKLYLVEEKKRLDSRRSRSRSPRRTRSRYVLVKYICANTKQHNCFVS